MQNENSEDFIGHIGGDDFIIVTHIDGIELQSKSDGGEGPLRTMVFLDVLVNDEEVQDIFQNSEALLHYHAAFPDRGCPGLDRGLGK